MAVFPDAITRQTNKGNRSGIRYSIIRRVDGKVVRLSGMHMSEETAWENALKKIKDKEDE